MNITTADLRRLCPKAKDAIIAPLVAAMAAGPPGTSRRREAGQACRCPR